MFGYAFLIDIDKDRQDELIAFDEARIAYSAAIGAQAQGCFAAVYEADFDDLVVESEFAAGIDTERRCADAVGSVIDICNAACRPEIFIRG